MLARRTRAALVLSLVVICAVLLPTITGQHGMASADAAPTIAYVRYAIDRSAVPDWVIFHDVTLRIPVGSADACWAWGDGMPLRLHHDRGSGFVRITTAASELLLAVRGTDITPESIGACQVTTLKDDKAWAYSLTFDDGHITVYENALPLLQRYGYRAGVAVIGQWLVREDAVENDWCGSQEALSLLANGWSVFNHSYSHSNSPADTSFEEAWLCQEAIRTRLGGYRATVFTVPYTNDQWTDIINGRSQELGIHLMQLYSDNGMRLEPVDQAVHLSEGDVYHLGRDDIKDWIDSGYNYFDQAHSRAIQGDPEHVWVSLHAHNVLYSEDWCAVAESSAYLYETYGEGGTDEVWVAPADEVLQYLLVRSAIEITQSESVQPGAGEQPREDQLVAFQQGMNGYTGWQDTYIMEWSPEANYAGLPQLISRGGTPGRSSMLFRVDPEPPESGAYVQSAVLSLYALTHTRCGDIDLSLYPLIREWDPAEVTWLNAHDGELWDTPGALASAVDRGSEPIDIAHVGACEGDERWYHFDVTDLVAYWTTLPERNEGFVVTAQDDQAKGIHFAGSNYHDTGLRPVLRVSYRWPLPEATAAPTVTATPTQEPTIPPTATAEPTLPAVPTRVYLPLLRR